MLIAFATRPSEVERSDLLQSRFWPWPGTWLSIAKQQPYVHMLCKAALQALLAKSAAAVAAAAAAATDLTAAPDSFGAR